MATHYADIRLQLALARTLHRLRALPQPSWTSALAAVGVAVVAMWWIMSLRTPDIDPRSVIAAHLAAAELAVRQERYIEPLDRSALHYYAAVLAMDPSNDTARRGVDSIAEHYVERTKTFIVTGRIADAAVALDDLRRVQPSHRRISLLDAQLRRAIDERALLRSPVRTEKQTQLASSTARKAPISATRAAERPKASATPKPGAAPAREAAPQDEPARAPETTMLAAASPANATAQSPPLLSALLSAAPAASTAAALERPAPAATDAGPTTAPAPERTLVKYVPPEYPREAMLRGMEGWIDVKLSVTPAGDVVNPIVEDGKARQLFDRAALSAVRRWKYEPRPDQSGPETVQVRVSFQLKD